MWELPFYCELENFFLYKVLKAIITQHGKYKPYAHKFMQVEI